MPDSLKPSAGQPNTEGWAAWDQVSGCLAARHLIQVLGYPPPLHSTTGCQASQHLVPGFLTHRGGSPTPGARQPDYQCRVARHSMMGSPVSGSPTPNVGQPDTRCWAAWHQVLCSHPVLGSPIPGVGLPNTGCEAAWHQVLGCPTPGVMQPDPQCRAA